MIDAAVAMGGYTSPVMTPEVIDCETFEEDGSPSSGLLVFVSWCLCSAITRGKTVGLSLLEVWSFATSLLFQADLDGGSVH